MNSIASVLTELFSVFVTYSTALSKRTLCRERIQTKSHNFCGMHLSPETRHRALEA